MANNISFMSANYVARQLDYHMTKGWMQGDRATNAYFQPRESFAERFEEILRDVRAMGFEAIDVWVAHLNWRWAGDEHVALARDLLARYDLPVASLAGGYGETREEFEAACKLARAIDTPILGGATPLLYTDRDFVVATLEAYDLKLAIENHPEKTAQEMLDKIGDGGRGRIGTTVDTGWYGTHGYDAARAIEELGEHVLHVHLKDVLAPGGHETCRYGRGCVPIQGCVQVLKEMGYSGYYSVEHEPEDYDPMEDCTANLAMLRQWLED
jgi:L-ribulose-5-phosphate 3-epimerase